MTEYTDAILNIKENQVIIVKKIEQSNTMLTMYTRKTNNEEFKKILETTAFIGKNGMTLRKIEGDGKTPIGKYKLGIAFGTHDISLNDSVKYIKINENLYWVDDINSKYYNQLVDIGKVQKDWISAEHLIDYKVEYEYGIEIKTNPHNIKNKGSAIFLHCSTDNPTAGCIAVKKEAMIEILKNIKQDTLIITE